MSERICPVCNVQMEKQSSPDLTIDVCPKCEGIFLDKNELNVLATGVAGNIERMTADDIDNDDRFPNRKCPDCSESTMRKMELLGCSNIVFDYCESCEGFFLDKGELGMMNSELARLSNRKLAEEFRGEVNGYLVRKDRTNTVGHTATGGIAGAFYVRVSVYFQKPLNAGIRLTSENIGDKLLKLIRLSKKQDIRIGNASLDGKLIVQADDTSAATSLLSQNSIADAIISYLTHRPRLFTFATTFELMDDCVVCSGGPYAERLNYNVEEDPEGVVEALIAVAKAIDGRL